MKALELQRRIAYIYSQLNIVKKSSHTIDDSVITITEDHPCYGKDYKGYMNTWWETTVTKVDLATLSVISAEREGGLASDYKINKTDVNFSTTIDDSVINDLYSLATTTFRKDNNISELSFSSDTDSKGELVLVIKYLCLDDAQDIESYYKLSDCTNSESIMRREFGNYCFSQSKEDDEKDSKIMDLIFGSNTNALAVAH